MKNDRIINAPISKIVEAIVKKDLEVWNKTTLVSKIVLDPDQITEALSTLPTVEMSEPIAAVTKGWGIMQHATDLGKVVSPDEYLFIGTLQECVDFVNEHQPLRPSEREVLMESGILDYVQHLPTCNIMQDWSESDQAFADTPTHLRDADFNDAVSQAHEMRKKCTCGADRYLAEKHKTENK